LKILVLGDSQAAGPPIGDPEGSAATVRANIGPWLEWFLEQEGHEVQRVGKPGQSSGKLTNTARGLGLPKQSWDRVYILAGGNDTLNTDAYRELISLWSAPVVAVSQPPATLIGDKGLGKRMFGISEANFSPDYFFPKTAASREKKNEAYKGVVGELQKSGVEALYLDVRDFDLPEAVEQPSGVVFPVQPDGIHVEGRTARAVAQQVVHPDSGSVFPFVVAGVALGLIFKRFF